MTNDQLVELTRTWKCTKCGVGHHVGLPNGTGRKAEFLRCPNCGLNYACAVDQTSGKAICYIDRPHIGNLYRQGRCKHCAIPLFGYEDIERDDCGCCAGTGGKPENCDDRLLHGRGRKGIKAPARTIS